MRGDDLLLVRFLVVILVQSSNVTIFLELRKGVVIVVVVVVLLMVGEVEAEKPGCCLQGVVFMNSRISATIGDAI